jgi:hypothetical protein
MASPAASMPSGDDPVAPAADPTGDFRRLLADMAAIAGRSDLDLDDGHGRWHLYEHLIDRRLGFDLLRPAVAAEDDKVLAAAVVVRVLEVVPDEERDHWVALLPVEHQAYSRRRADETRALDRAKAGSLAVEEGESNLDSWSDWLQLRLSAQAVDVGMIALLAERGRTKRIRRAAAERLVPRGR